MNSWKNALKEQMSPQIAQEVDIYETQLELRRQGKLDEALFNETRLRRGVYGQRYDNGQRHDGIRPRSLAYPNKTTFKGPGTLWDAPGMVRIKIPMGKISPEQIECIAAPG